MTWRTTLGCLVFIAILCVAVSASEPEAAGSAGRVRSGKASAPSAAKEKEESPDGKKEDDKPADFVYRSFKAKKVRSTLYKDREDAYYLLSLPEKPPEGKKKSPLIIVMHGGDNNVGEATNKSSKFIIDKVRLAAPEAILLVPSAMWNGRVDRWGCVCNQTHVLSCLEDTIADQEVDLRRIYMFGHSMGGQAGLHFAFWYGRIFSAIVSASGGSWDFTDPKRKKNLAWYLKPWPARQVGETRLRMLSGEKDYRTAPMKSFVDVINSKLRKKIPFEIVPGAPHSLPKETYMEMARWLLEQGERKGKVLASKKQRWKYIKPRLAKRFDVIKNGVLKAPPICTVCGKNPKKLLVP